MTTEADDPHTLVSTGWLADRLGDPDLRILDASWHLPTEHRDAAADFAARHIPGACFYDIDAESEPGTALPHMAPSVERFAARMGALGIGDRQQVVVYDSIGIFSAPRVWWTFRLMGLPLVAVLDGGLPKWLAEGREVATFSTVPPLGHLNAVLRADLVRDAAAVARACHTREAQIVDARAAPRFRGEMPEPRPGLRAGHIPEAVNLPFPHLLTPEGTMKPAGPLREAFGTAGVDLARPVITTCGSGVTAAILSLALERTGHRDHALYDGSWAEWGAREDLPVARG